VTAYVAPYLVDGDPISAEAVQEFLETVQALDASSLIKLYRQAASAPLTVTTGGGTMTGSALSVPVTGNNAFALVTAVFDVENTSAGTVFQGFIYQDGVAAEPVVVKDCQVADRATLATTYLVKLPLATYSFDLRAAKTVNVGTVTAYATNSTMTVLLVDLP
jgi:hypothetical protein